MQRLAVIDLGSSSFHALVADVGPGERIREIWSGKHMLRLGAYMGHIPDHAVRSAMHATSELTAAARAHSCRHLSLVATSALREAHDGSSLVRALEQVAACPIQVLSGTEEACLAYRGARARLRDLPERVGVIDLGGGSTELAIGDRQRVYHAESLPLGFLPVAQRYGEGVPLGQSTRRAIARTVADRIAAALPRVAELDPAAWILSGGTARRLAALWPPGAALSLRSLRALADELAVLPPELLIARGCDASRAPTLGAASTLLAAVAESLGAAQLRISPGGLRDGALLRDYDRLLCGQAALRAGCPEPESARTAP